jgi:hypothetical protein
MFSRHSRFIINNANLKCINNDTSFSGDDVHLIRKILDPKYLDRAEDTYRDMQLTIQRHGTWASAWVSESGGVFNNGGPLVSNTFINSIWSALIPFNGWHKHTLLLGSSTMCSL